MPIGILNNIASLAAENQLTVTNSSLQNTLLQLSSGDRINSGADDPAGLAIANGLQANVTALTQSEQNVSDGTGMLQVADGALSQVTTLLNRAVTLATESSTGTVSDSQRVALQAEFSQITQEIDQIGSNTTYNGAPVFQGGSENFNQVMSGNVGGSTAGLTTPVTGSIAFSSNGTTLFTANANGEDATVGDMINEINNSGTGLVAALGSQGQLIVTDTLNRGSDAANALTAVGTGFYVGSEPTAANADELQIAATAGQAVTGTMTITAGSNTVTTSAKDTTTDEVVADINSQSAKSGIVANFNGTDIVLTDTNGNGDLAAAYNGFEVGGAAPAAAASPGDVGSLYNPVNANVMNVFLSDSTIAGSAEIGVDLGSFSSGNMNGISLANDNLSSQSAAQTALTDINNAISQVAALRGQIGASTERLQSATNVIASQSQNLTSAEDNIMEADIPTAVANLTNYSILEQTGISALAQANQQQQLVLKLLQ
jgi:flagellin